MRQAGRPPAAAAAAAADAGKVEVTDRTYVLVWLGLVGPSVGLRIPKEAYRAANAGAGAKGGGEGAARAKDPSSPNPLDDFFRDD
ncbi:MAG: hypothetical protein BJ554DRAFT_915 [Olpidium bornovanus]|uniref:Uncharacterized protein n=1 Tax=Olpidium bornovanus TaxID=278681 RepID=A0A8H8DHU7_9FUNG|nr:MAG: hypothetical protein BJ554DRAFT_915 [Olpidium bornovanus]